MPYVEPSATSLDPPKAYDNTARVGRVPLTTVHALYKMKEFYVPVYDAVSYDVDLLCIACKMRPIYKPCTRLAKKSCCQRFKSRCLQCLVEHKLTSGSERYTMMILDAFSVCNTELECWCHLNYLSLLFPSFMLFASESSIKMVLRVCVMTTLADMMSKGGDRCAMTKRIDSRIVGQVRSTSGDSTSVEKKQYVDRHYLYQLVSEYATDHFMICGGICSELRTILRVSGVSNKMFELVNLMSMVIGQSSLVAAPSADAVRETDYLKCGGRRFEDAAEGGENFIGRLRYRLRMMTCHIRQDATNTKIQYSYCPSCHINISTIVKMLPEICKPDSIYDISQRQGIYNTDVTRRQAEKTQKKREQEYF